MLSNNSTSTPDRIQQQFILATDQFADFLEHIQAQNIPAQQISLLIKLTDALLSETFDLDKAWNCLGDYAIDYIDDIENPPVWFEDLYDAVRDIRTAFQTVLATR